MRLVTIRPTRLDREVASTIVRRTNTAAEGCGKVLTFFASEKVVYGAAGAIWFMTRFGDDVRRRQGNHLLTAIIASAIVQRGLKQIVAQERPDREVAKRRRKGIPRSGKAYDAFPSGHAMNLGVLAPVLSEIWPERRRAIWTVSLLVAGTRIFLLAHWLSDVLSGFAFGAAIEGLMRPVTGASPEPTTRVNDVPGKED